MNYLTAKDLGSVWEDVTQEHKTILGITAGTKTITAKQQFEAFFLGRALISDDIEALSVTFHVIFNDNYFLLKQIGEYQEMVEKLTNLDNWQDVTKTDSTNILDGTVKTDNTNRIKSRSGNSDNNSLMEESRLKNFLNVEGTDPIPANTLTQTDNKTVDDGKIKTDNTATVEGKTSSSNTSQDLRNFLHTELPQLRTKFWWKFIILFQ